MPDKTTKKIWGAPLMLGVIILFGLLSALLGTGIWYPLSWAAMLIPLVVISWFFWKSKVSNKKAT